MKLEWNRKAYRVHLEYEDGTKETKDWGVHSHQAKNYLGQKLKLPSVISGYIETYELTPKVEESE